MAGTSGAAFYSEGKEGGPAMVRSSHMKQTSHFQLNQYEASDRILHGGFNSDNQKIDTALAETRAAAD